MNKQAFIIINLLVVIATIFMSYYSNTGALNDNTMGSLSNEYSSVFTPAGYAFSIWGLIYFGLIGHAIHLFGKKAEAVQIQAKWMALANLGNIAWVFLWLYEFTALSVLAMSFILYCLVRLTVELNIGFKKLAVWTWWPISIYTGWIVVALVANTSAYLSKVGWEWLLSENAWAIVIMLISFFIYLFLLLKRNLAYSAYVGVWALGAIAMKHWDNLATVQWVAFVLAIILFGISVWQDYKTRTALKAYTSRAVQD